MWIRSAGRPCAPQYERAGLRDDAPRAASSQLDLTGANAPPTAVVRRPAAVTFTPATGDTDVAGYRFAVADQPGTPASWVPANRDGSATVAVTPVSDDPFLGNTLTVVAVDRAGNASTQVTYRFLANPATGSPHVRGDVTGDGRAELIRAGDIGNGQMQAWALAADPAATGFVGNPVAGWDAGPGSGFTAARTTVVSGDFDGDGRTDAGVLHDETGGRTTFMVLTATGNGFAAPSAPQWDSQVVGGAWAYPSLKVAVGDVNGDQRDDLVVLANFGSSWRISVLRSTSSPGSLSFKTELWATGISPWTSVKIVVADFTGEASTVERKNSWQLAEHAGHRSPDRFQRLLSSAAWDEPGVREDVGNWAVAALADPEAVLVVDDTGFLKKGRSSAGVQRQYSGTAGRVENCQIGVFLAYATALGRLLLDAELYLPVSWTDDPQRCARAGVPQEVGFATKPEMARMMIERVVRARLPVGWVAADEAYGDNPGLRRWLEGEGIRYVMAVSCDHLDRVLVYRRRARASAPSSLHQIGVGRAC